MSIESADDWKGLRQAGRIAHLTLDALEARVRPGVSTAELDAVAAHVFASHGARSAPAMMYGFPGTVLISSAGSAHIRHDRDGWTTRTTDGSWAAHHEHTLVITRDRPIVLTAG